jgi:serine/threonine protein kinase
MSLVVSEKLQDRYEVVRSIKSGGMGAVYEAVDHKLASTPCAIKEVLASALQGSSAAYVLASFESEMKALAGLEHPNIPRVRDYFEVDGKRYIILDLVQGQALDDELAEHLRLTNAPMDPAVAAVDMVQVLETLTYLHNCQPPIIHRDIKSANLIRDKRSGRIKLVDFGIARSVETQKVQTQVGTPGFCAPEQMGGRAELRSDLYSVGATLYHLCTGRLPPPFTFDALEMDLPRSPGLVKIVIKATQPKPSERYANAEEMAQALRAWLRNEGSTKIDPSNLPQPVTRINPLATSPTPPNSQHGLWVAVLVMVLAALGLLYNDYSSRFGAPTPAPVAPTASSKAYASHSHTALVQDDKKTVAEMKKARAIVQQQARARESQLLARENARQAEAAKRLMAERARQERDRKAKELAALNGSPGLLPGEDYPHRVPHASSAKPGRLSLSETPAPAENINPGPASGSILERLPENYGPLTRTWLGPAHYTARYDGNVRGHRVQLDITTSPAHSAEQLRRHYAGQLAGMQEDRSREHSPGEYCGSRREGMIHHGIHIKDGLLYDLRISPPPANASGVFWGPILELIDRKL